MSDTLTASLRKFLACTVLLGAVSLANEAAAQGAPPQQGANPMCVRLEGQLATIDRGGGGDPARAEQLRRYEDAASKQQNELDRVTAQARRMGCDSSGFFSMFNGQSAQCGPVNNQIQQMRGNLDQITSNLERLRVGTPGSSDRDSQRRSVLLALAQNNCGPQYAAAARNPAPGSGAGTFLNNLFGNNEPSPDAPPLDAAVSISGQPYTSSPNAFKYRTEFNPSCSCKAQGQTWSDALKNIDDKAAAENGDIIVTEERAKRMSLPPAKGTPVSAKKGAAPPPAETPAAAPAAPADPNKPIRSVGPTFLPKAQ